MNKMMKITGMMMGLGLIGLTATASAETDAPTTNKRAARMAKMDTNGDGQLQVEELIKHWYQRIVARVQKMDSNQDGIISKAERKEAKVVRQKARAERAEAKAERQAKKAAQKAERKEVRAAKKAARQAEKAAKQMERKKLRAAKKAERRALKKAERMERKKLEAARKPNWMKKAAPVKGKVGYDKGAFEKGRTPPYQADPKWTKTKA